MYLALGMPDKTVVQVVCTPNVEVAIGASKDVVVVSELHG
jgi:hypothetical protein